MPTIPSSRLFQSPRRAAWTGGFAAAVPFLLAACQPAVAPAGAAGGPARPPAVPVVDVRSAPVDGGPAQLARVEAAQRVDVQPRVGGHIAEVLFREGDRVHAGQALFRIDPRPFDAAVARARAELALAAAREELAANEAGRAQRLAAEAAIAAEELERRQAARAEAGARRSAAEAALRTAELDREFSVIRSPIDGRIGRALVTAGNYVDAGSRQSPLATIVSVSPLHVHFDVAAPEVVAQAAQARTGGRWTVRILDADGRRELARAPVDFADNEIAAGTGTLRLRARVDAPGAAMLPGQFVRVQLATGDRRQALMVPEKAIGTDQGRRFVYVVGADGKVEYRTVELGAAQGGQRIVAAGLAAGEQVVVNGLMRVRPGMTVQPQPAEAVAGQS